MPSPCIASGSTPTQPENSNIPEARLSAMVTDCLDLFLLGLTISDIPVKALLDSGATH